LEINSPVPIAINETKECAEAFLLALLQKASDTYEARNELSKATPKESRIFLVGDVGVGKTTFFKYLRYEYKETIDNFDCFFLHLDLTKDYLRKLKLQDALKFYSCQIFRRDYYAKVLAEKEQEFLNAIKEGYTKGLLLNEGIRSDFEESFKQFAAKYDPQRNESFSKLLQTSISDYIENNYPTVYVVDGLDNVDDRESFFEKIEDIYDIISNENRKGYFIFVMRNETHREMIKNHANASARKDITKLLSDYKTFKIAQPKLHELIEKRLVYLEMRWDKIIKTKKASILGRQKLEIKTDLDIRTDKLILELKKYMTVEQMQAYLNVLLLFINHGIQFDKELEIIKFTKKQAITDLKDLIGYNYRKLMEVINVCHAAFLETLETIPEIDLSDVISIGYELEKEETEKDEAFFKTNHKLKQILAKHYLVIPKLLFNRASYEHPYKYVLNTQKDKIVRIDKTKFAKFIYSLYYPVNHEGYYGGVYNLLLKIRILQYINYHSEKDSINIIDNDYVADYFSKCFPYVKSDINKALEELIDTHLLKYEHSPTILYRLDITRVGKYTVEKLIYDFGYIRIIISDLLVPQKIAYLFEKDLSKNDTQKEIAIINQIPRIALFVLLIKKVEEEEQKLIKNRRNLENYDCIINKKLIEEVKNTLHRICGKHDDINLGLTKNAFTKHYEKKN
jgi:GTPase SAR1 family protein